MGAPYVSRCQARRMTPGAGFGCVPTSGPQTGLLAPAIRSRSGRTLRPDRRAAQRSGSRGNVRSTDLISTATEMPHLGTCVRVMRMIVERADHNLRRQIDERLDVAVDDRRAA